MFVVDFRQKKPPWITLRCYIRGPLSNLGLRALGNAGFIEEKISQQENANHQKHISHGSAGEKVFDSNCFKVYPLDFTNTTSSCVKLNSLAVRTAKLLGEFLSY